LGFADTMTELARTLDILAAVGRPIEIVIALAAVALLATIVVPALQRWRRPALAGLTALLVVGELVLVWFHLRLWQLTAVVDPMSGQTTGHVAVPLWVESEKLYVWALILALMLLLARKHGEELLPVAGVILVVLTFGAVFIGKPFSDPLPSFLEQYGTYLSVMVDATNPNAMVGLFQGLEGSRRFYYNTWYMWIHPPLLFISYGAFVMSFSATVLMVAHRRSSYEETAYWWARFGYLPLTAGMMLGFPWALLAWGDESWWWSGKVNISLMMWLLYTAYLHARLYLRARGMWRVVAALSILSFVALVLTYVTTYIVPGAHSVA
jgi:cytochrome c biogenesis factor